MGWSLRPSSSGTAPRFHLCLRVQRDRAGSAERVTDGRLLPPHPKGKSTKKEKHPPQQGRRSAQGVPPALCQLRAGGFPPRRLQSPWDGGILRWSTIHSPLPTAPQHHPKGSHPPAKPVAPISWGQGRWGRSRRAAAGGPAVRPRSHRPPALPPRSGWHLHFLHGQRRAPSLRSDFILLTEREH